MKYAVTIAVLLAACATARADPNVDFLLNTDAMRCMYAARVKLDDKQRETIKKIEAKYVPQAMKLKQKYPYERRLKPGATLARKQENRKLEQQFKLAVEELRIRVCNEGVTEMLTKQQRMKACAWQVVTSRSGLGLANDDAVAAALRLTDAQEKIRKQVADDVKKVFGKMESQQQVYEAMDLAAIMNQTYMKALNTAQKEWIRSLSDDDEMKAWLTYEGERTDLVASRKAFIERRNRERLEQEAAGAVDGPPGSSGQLEK